MTAHTGHGKSHGNPYMGNIGNLMQHWTFCELLTAANQHESHLNFIDAHAMAPFATRRKRQDPDFDKIQSGLLYGKTPYEQAWRKLAPGGTGYPNSAAFLMAVWEGCFSFLLCEIDCPTAAQLTSCTKHINDNCTDCRRAETYCGDWRNRFDKGLPEDGLMLISFDPYKYIRHDREQKVCGNLYPSDLDKLLCTIRNTSGGILIQISTYSTRCDNNQNNVKKSIGNILVKRGTLKPVALVKANDRMMSLVYARNVDWDDNLQTLGNDFKEWLKPPEPAPHRRPFSR